MVFPYLASSQGGGYLGTAGLGWSGRGRCPIIKTVLERLIKFHLVDKIFMHLQPVCFLCSMYYELEVRAHTLLKNMFSLSENQVKDVQDKID